MDTVQIWIHYEKIKRIYTYCAKLFHNVEQCPDRTQISLVAREDHNFDRFGLWMSEDNRIPMQLVENQLKTHQDALPCPSKALSELRQAFAGVRMDSSMVQPSCHQLSLAPQMSRMGFQHIEANPSAAVPPVIIVTSTLGAMNVDNSAIVPFSATKHANNALFTTQIQHHQNINTSVQPHHTQQAML